MERLTVLYFARLIACLDVRGAATTNRTDKNSDSQRVIEFVRVQVASSCGNCMEKGDHV